MADVTINDLTGQAPVLTDVFPFSTTGITPSTYKATLQQIKTALDIPTQTSQLINNSGFMSTTQTGTAPYFGIRAFVRFAGDRDINGNLSTSNTNRQIFTSGNVSSVVRTSLGNFDINLTTPLASTNCAVVANIIHAFGFTTDVHIDAYAFSTTIIRTWCSWQPNTVSYDSTGVDVLVIQ